MIRQKEIYLAGGCFWGMQAYFQQITGVIETTVGYANGQLLNPTYEKVCQGHSGYAETVYIQYDETLISLSFLLHMYVQVIDPISINRQGNDYGSQYRTGIYYVEHEDVEVIQEALAQLQTQYIQPIVVECASLQNFYPAEHYHQDYLMKHPNGYCHISRDKINEAAKANDTTI